MFINFVSCINQGVENLYTSKNKFCGFLWVVLAEINSNFCRHIVRGVSQYNKQTFIQKITYNYGTTRTHFRGK
jgi:hypothetical protein